MAFPELTQGDPEAAGFSSIRLNRLQQGLRQRIDAGELAGTVALVARQDKLVHFSALGHANREAAAPMTAESIFRIYSMTKPVTSFALLMLYEEGRFRLNEPVERYIPEFGNLQVYHSGTRNEMKLVPLARPVTIRDLLIHTAGLTYGLFNDSPVEALYREQGILDPATTLAEMVLALAEIPLAHQPGERWNYSIATTVVGYLIQVLAGMPLDHFFQERIFGPLGMVDTGFFVAETKWGRLTNVYGPARGQGEELVVVEPQTSRFKQPQARLSGGGGLVSTAADYLQFLRMLRGGGAVGGVRLVGRKTVELMTANHLRPEQMPMRYGKSTNYGYGFGLGVRPILDVAQTEQLGSRGAYDWSGAATTSFFVDPVEDIIAIFLTQYMPYNPAEILRNFRLWVYQALVE
jgi:CubicO group peptidase (beta-lactamase class C family)